MGAKRGLLFFSILVASWGCGVRLASTPPRQKPAPASSTITPSRGPVVEGESVEAAVVVAADNEEDGVAFENEWIYRHYGRFRRRSGGVASLGGRRYDVITVELSDHTQRTLYFDITDFFGRERPPSK